MAWYLRKSMRLGPVRLNFSKSGVGVSAGVTGARIGVNAKGRAYTHVGRYGLYARSSLGSASASRSRVAAGGESMGAFIDTGVTFGSSEGEPGPHFDSPQRSADRGALLIAGCILAVLLAIYFATKQSVAFDQAAAALVAAVLLGFFAVRSVRRRRSGDRLAALLKQKLLGVSGMADTDSQSIKAALHDPRLSASDKDAITKFVYVSLLENVIDEALSGKDRIAEIQAAERLLGIPEDYASRMRLVAYRRAHLEAVSDHKLTAEEEGALDSLRRGLNINLGDVSDELRVFEELHRVRGLFEGQIPIVATTVPLQRGEICHFIDAARILKSKVLRSYQSGGQRVKLEGHEVDAEGQMLVTSKRILILHSGTTSIPLAKIMDVRVNPTTKLITIAKDGAAKPVLITAPRALEAAVLLQTLIHREE